MLPSHVNPNLLQTDPAGREDHVYHPPTDEAICVGVEEAHKLLKHPASGKEESEAESPTADQLMRKTKEDLIMMAEADGHETASEMTKAEIVAMLTGDGG